MADGVNARGGCATFLIILVALAAGALGYALFMSRADDSFSVQPMVTGFQRQNELTVFRAQLVTVPTTKVDGMVDMLDRVQTSILPARVRYTVDLSRMTDRDVSWNNATRTATVTVPPVIVQPAEVDPVARRVFRTGPPAAAATWDDFGRSNAIKARREAASLAKAPELLRMAEASARDAVAANAELFLRGAGIADAKVVVRFANEGRTTERMDRSTPLKEAVAR
jgi:hypothetical protein